MFDFPVITANYEAQIKQLDNLLAKPQKHRDALVEAAAELFCRQGFAATGTKAILEKSGAPRGSLYHYFPEGKEAIGAAAVEAAGKTLTNAIKKLGDELPCAADFVIEYATMLAEWMERSDYTNGNPISTIVLETVPQSAMITPVAHRTHEIWVEHVCEMLAKENWPEDRRRATSQLILSAFEGALVAARASHSSEPLHSIASEMAIFLRSQRPE